MPNWSVIESPSSKEIVPSLYQHQALVVQEEDKNEQSTLMVCYGGEDATGFWTNCLYTLNLVTFEWKKFEWAKEKHSVFPPKKDGHTMIQNGRNILIFGGNSNQHFQVDNSFVYSLNLDSLEFKKLETKAKDNDNTNMPSGCSLHTVVLNTNDNCMYVFGGKTTALGERKYLNELFKFSLQEAEWTRIESLNSPSPRCSHTCVFDQKQNKLLIFGGITEDYGYSNELYTFDCSANVWSKIQAKGSVPEGRERHSAVLYDNGNNMLVFGGWIHGGVSFHVYDLDLLSWEWNEKPSPTADEKSYITSQNNRRYGHTAVVYNYGKQMLICGGKNQYWKNISDLLVYNLAEADAEPLKTPSTSSIALDLKYPKENNILYVDSFKVNQIIQQVLTSDNSMEKESCSNNDIAPEKEEDIAQKEQINDNAVTESEEDLASNEEVKEVVTELAAYIAEH